MKTAKVKIDDVKDTDGWCSLAYELLFDNFKAEHPDLDDDELSDLFYTTVVSKIFEYGEFANFELEIDENFNVVGGKIIPFSEK